MSERINLTELKEKAADTAGLILEKALVLKDTAEEKARILAKKAKLRAEMARNGSEIKRLYTDLGSLYYCMKKDAPDDMMKQACEEITLLLEKNNTCEAELRALEEIENPGTTDDEDITVEIVELNEPAKAEEAHLEPSSATEEESTNS